MRDLVFAVLDTETTGLDPADGHRVVELAAVKIRSGEISRGEVFETLLDPERSIPPGASQVSGIADADLVGAPKFAEKIAEFEKFLAGIDVVIAHNASFDKNFLDAEAELAGAKISWPRIVCSVELSKSFFPEAARHRLDDLAERLGIPIPGKGERHRALADVLLTAEAVLALASADPEKFRGFTGGAAAKSAAEPEAGAPTLFG